ncbi:MAG: chemotaxis protein CheW [Acidobacteria bacterium]|nr:chemotaxis protein CheW [Acidobacteriota bacterium]
MLLLVFQAGPRRFGMEAARLIEVVPAIRLYQPPQAPAWVAGVMDYRGATVPVVDLTALYEGVPSPPLLSTRIMLVHYETPAGGPRTLGLLAEKVTETLALDSAAFSPAGVELPGTPSLGELSFDEAGTLQMIRPERILSDEVRDRLFIEPEGR